MIHTTSSMIVSLSALFSLGHPSRISGTLIAFHLFTPNSLSPHIYKLLLIFIYKAAILVATIALTNLNKL